MSIYLYMIQVKLDQISYEINKINKLIYEINRLQYDVTRLHWFGHEMNRINIINYDKKIISSMA